MSGLLVLIAALGSSALTGAVAFGLEWWRSNRAGKAAQAERRSRAYSMLLTRSIIIAHLAADLHAVMEVRSGIKEGIDVTMRLQKALDPLEMQFRLRAEILPLYEAWSEVWVVGSKEAIPEANDLVARCGAVVSAATQHGEAQAKWLRGITGEKWTQQQLDQWQAELHGLAEARKRLGGVARRETGVEVVDLYASNESINP